MSSESASSDKHRVAYGHPGECDLAARVAPCCTILHQGTFGEHSIRVERTPMSLHPNCKKHLKKIPRLTQNTTCKHEYLRQGGLTRPNVQGEHAGNIQGAFREHSGSIQGTFREHSGNIQGTFGEHSGNIIQGTLFREHSGNIQKTLREDSENFQGTFRERSGNIEHSRNVQGTFREYSTFREHSGNIQGTIGTIHVERGVPKHRGVRL